MFQIFRRIGFLRRRWIWALLLLGLFAFAGYWIAPWRGPAADLRVVAMRPDGTFADTVDGAQLMAARARVTDSTAAALSGARGVPLVLGIANVGVRGARPDRLMLALPRWYRLKTSAPVLRQEVLPDEPLQRYVLDLDFPQIQSHRVPTLLPAVDTLWLEPWVPDYWCTADADSIPQLIPSTPPDTGGVVSVRIYWSFDGDALDQRQTGLLTVDLPGTMFRREGARDITQSEVHLGVPRALRPGMDGLIEGGTRYSECGAPGDPMRIFAALWLTPEGGRLISVHYGGLPRKEYYDLNRDSIIELEMWDPDGDGEMEAWRSLSVPIPDYLLPEDPILAARDSARADSIRLAARADSVARADSSARALAAAGPSGADTSARVLPAGARPTLAELSRLLIPGDPATARRLFVRRPPPRPVRPLREDGPIGIPLDRTREPIAPLREQPRPMPEQTPPPPPPPPREEPAPQEEPAQPPAAQPEEPDLIDRALQQAAERDTEQAEPARPEDRR